MSTLSTLLGTHLLRDESKISTAEAIKGKKYLALYFSAHWCPPCRGFTPVLAAKYRASNGDTEVVFISSDQDDASFNEYFRTMPWLALPYSARELKSKISNKFEIRGIPTLVVLDASTGKLITKDGRAQVDTYFSPQSPRSVATRPAAPPSPFEALLGGELLRGKDRVKTNELVGGGKHKNVCLYFSAHWCPPCRGFTPVLAAKYRASNGDTEVVFVSSDQSPKAFQGYFDSMPWLALPYSASQIKAKLSEQFGVRGIPTLVVLDGRTGELITTSGRSKVDQLFEKKTRATKAQAVAEATDEASKDAGRASRCGGCTVC